jgi:hypothetical protein
MKTSAETLSPDSLEMTTTSDSSIPSSGLSASTNMLGGSRRKRRHNKRKKTSKKTHKKSKKRSHKRRH